MRDPEITKHLHRLFDARYKVKRAAILLYDVLHAFETRDDTGEP